jgi:hypothetical protein
MIPVCTHHRRNAREVDSLDRTVLFALALTIQALSARVVICDGCVVPVALHMLSRRVRMLTCPEGLNRSMYSAMIVGRSRLTL